MIYKDFILANDLEDDEHFFKYDLVRVLQESVGIDQSFDFDRQIEEFYFMPEMLGSFEEMAYGILDVS